LNTKIFIIASGGSDLMFPRENWLSVKSENGRTHFEVLQRKQDPLKIWLIGIGCFLISVFWLVLFGDSDASIRVALNWVFGIIGFISFWPTFAGFILIPMWLLRKEKVIFNIMPEEIILEIKNNNSYPSKMERQNISEIYIDNSYNTRYPSNEVHLRKETMSESAAQALKLILFESTNYIAVNYLGKAIKLADNLSQEEASYLYKKIKEALGV
jgi:hypothetical protein